MKRIAEFEIVSKEQFEQDYIRLLGQELPEGVYENIKRPSRATRGSAGYDFYSPIDFTLEPGESITIPTGIRVKMEEDWVLSIFPRSGLGMRYRLQLNNTVGIIDSDYYYSGNQGHIMVPLTNDSRERKVLTIEAGKGLVQGIFLQYGITLDDASNEVRDGGFGSTDK